MQINPSSIKLLDEFNSENCLTNILLNELNKIFKILNFKYGCTYASYVLESEPTGKKIQISTNPTWANYFYFENLMQHCPIVEIVRKINSESFENSTLVWNIIKPRTREEKLVIGLRGEFSVSNGITFTTFLSHHKYGIYLEAINLAGNKIDVNFYKEVLQNKGHISSLIYDLRCKGYKTLTSENDKLFESYMLGDKKEFIGHDCNK